jgi:hypothetical protein
MTNAIDLLRTLGAGKSSASSNSAAGTQLAGSNFADLLNKASGGLLSSGLQVSVAKDANVDLSQDQLQRLSKAADAAEAQGANRVLVMMDGQAYKLDVGVRQITGKVDMSGVVTGVDGVVAVPDGAGLPAASGLHSLSKVPNMNASLLDALSKFGQ